MKWIYCMAALLMAGAGTELKAQGYVDQEAVAALLETQGNAGLDEAPATWHEYHFRKQDKTTKTMLAHLQAHLDSLPGGLTGQRMQVVELSNRVCSKYMMQRPVLMVPDSFAGDFRAYAPYPAHYAGADSLPKLFVIDKYTQTFGAYEGGRLVRWGLISSGHDDDLTPNGRYAFNWKQEYRESSEAPEGETWKMRWVVNFIESKGVHVHQYQLPIAMPASHGCVRLSEADAIWNFGWASEGKNGSGTPVIVINHNPAGLAAHWLDAGGDQPISLVSLPDSPMDVPANTRGKELAGW